MEAGRAAYCCGIILGFSLGFGAAHVAITSHRADGNGPVPLDLSAVPADEAQAPNEIRLSFGDPDESAGGAAVVALAELPGGTSPAADEAPQTLSDPAQAAPLAARAVKDDEVLRSMIRQELAHLPASDHEVWYEALRDLPHDDATSILRIWKSNQPSGPGPLPAASDSTRTDSSTGSPATTAIATEIPPIETSSPQLRRRLENLANADTPGFKALECDAQPDGSPMPQVQIDVRPGKAVSTGRPFDLRIEGLGFFAVKFNDELLYTRRGRLVLDDQRRLSVPLGQGRLATLQPEIVVPPRSREIRVEPQGTVLILGPEGGVRQKTASIGIWTFLDPTGLEPVLGGLYRPSEHSGEAWSPTELESRGWIEQHAYEASNVDAELEQRAIAALKECHRGGEVNASAATRVTR
jgi:flagellar basal body rod protein FlgG